MSRMILNSLQLADYGAIFTFLIILVIAITCCIWCYCIRVHDMALQNYIMTLAKKRGLNVDPYTLHPGPCCQSPYANENCSIFVPEVGIIL